MRTDQPRSNYATPLMAPGISERFLRHNMADIAHGVQLKPTEDGLALELVAQYRKSILTQEHHQLKSETKSHTTMKGKSTTSNHLLLKLNQEKVLQASVLATLSGQQQEMLLNAALDRLKGRLVALSNDAKSHSELIQGAAHTADAFRFLMRRFAAGGRPDLMDRISSSAFKAVNISTLLRESVWRFQQLLFQEECAQYFKTNQRDLAMACTLKVFLILFFKDLL